jgi:hypothetical protein
MIWRLLKLRRSYGNLAARVALLTVVDRGDGRLSMRHSLLLKEGGRGLHRNIGNTDTPDMMSDISLEAQRNFGGGHCYHLHIGVSAKQQGSINNFENSEAQAATSRGRFLLSGKNAALV